MFSLIKEIFHYLSRPYLTRIPLKVERPFALLLKLAVICVFMGLAGGYFSDILISLKLIPDPGPNVLDNKSMPFWEFAFAAVLVAPVLEELIFRAQLRRFSGMVFFISLMIGAFLSSITNTSWAFLVCPFIFTVLFVIYRFTLAGSIMRKFRFWERVFPWHFHLTALCFALVHLSNFERGAALLPLGILYTLPQLSIGLILGFTRMNYGLKYSMALHAMYNLTFAIVLFSQY